MVANRLVPQIITQSIWNRHTEDMFILNMVSNICHQRDSHIPPAGCVLAQGKLAQNSCTVILQQVLVYFDL